MVKLYRHYYHKSQDRQLLQEAGKDALRAPGGTMLSLDLVVVTWMFASYLFDKLYM